MAELTCDLHKTHSHSHTHKEGWGRVLRTPKGGGSSQTPTATPRRAGHDGEKKQRWGLGQTYTLLLLPRPGARKGPPSKGPSSTEKDTLTRPLILLLLPLLVLSFYLSLSLSSSLPSLPRWPPPRGPLSRPLATPRPTPRAPTPGSRLTPLAHNPAPPP